VSDISFPGLAAFILFLLLLAVVGVVLLVSLYHLIRSRKKWPCNRWFGFGLGSVLAIVITLVLLFMAEQASVGLMKKLDQWAWAISILVLLNTAFVGAWYWRRNSKKC